MKKMKIPEIAIGGFEQGGTTFISEILRTGGYQSFFEMGVLLAESPQKYKNFEPLELQQHYRVLENDVFINARLSFKDEYPPLHHSTEGFELEMFDEYFSFDSFEKFYDSLFSFSFDGELFLIKPLNICLY